MRGVRGQGRGAHARGKRRDKPESESGITEKILKYLNALPGCHAEKVHVGMYGKRGTPDILGVYRGRALALEVKRPGEKPTPLQAYVLDLWAGAGAIAGVVDGVEAVELCLRRHLGDGEGSEERAG